jgi:DnaK suppressor protein
MPASKKKDPAAAASVLIHGIKPYVEKKDEEYMSKKMLEHFRTILNAWKQELLDEVSRTVHSMQDDTANHPDPNDRASQETDMSLELRSRDRERKLIKKIEEATAKIDSNDYGYCETCGVEIGVQRLEARPTATLCIDCKTLDEIREKQMG